MQHFVTLSLYLRCFSRYPYTHSCPCVEGEEEDRLKRYRGGQVYACPLSQFEQLDRPLSKKSMRSYPISATKGNLIKNHIINADMYKCNGMPFNQVYYRV